MKIINERPPNFEYIASYFPGAHHPGVIFAYDDAIYNPSGQDIPHELISHEKVHCDRQRDLGVSLWWQHYCNDAHFRFNEELLAHIAEYKAFCAGDPGGQPPSRQVKRRFLHDIATRLSSQLYGRMVSYNKAKEAILNG